MVHYNSGSYDHVNHHNKLCPRWVGPYVVLRPIYLSGRSTSVNFEFQDVSKPHAKAKIIHYNRTKPYINYPKNTTFFLYNCLPKLSDMTAFLNSSIHLRKQ